MAYAQIHCCETRRSRRREMQQLDDRTARRRIFYSILNVTVSLPSQWRRDQQSNGRRSMHLSQSQHLPTRFSQLFSDPETDSEDDCSEDEGEDSSDEIHDRRHNFLGRVQSYSKAMHAHTTFQLGSLSRGTLPSYTKTMHAFTLNQLNHHFNEGTTKSATNSPRLDASKSRDTTLLGPGGRTVMLTHKVWSDLSKLGFDEAPRGPSNSPVRSYCVEVGRMCQLKKATEDGVPLSQNYFSFNQFELICRLVGLRAVIATRNHS
ncbi:hypothetical protein KC335_g16 [Hortaea werneckii]|nr:hypothetical protein KC335_g16 [Hortaea werneckii]